MIGVREVVAAGLAAVMVIGVVETASARTRYRGARIRHYAYRQNNNAAGAAVAGAALGLIGAGIAGAATASSYPGYGYGYPGYGYSPRYYGPGYGYSGY